MLFQKIIMTSAEAWSQTLFEIYLQENIFLQAQNLTQTKSQAISPFKTHLRKNLKKSFFVIFI